MSNLGGVVAAARRRGAAARVPRPTRRALDRFAARSRDAPARRERGRPRRGGERSPDICVRRSIELLLGTPLALAALPCPAFPSVHSRSRPTPSPSPGHLPPRYQLLAQIKLSSSGSDIPSGIEFKVASALPAPISAVGAGRDAEELTGNAYRNSFYWNARDKTLCVVLTASWRAGPHLPLASSLRSTQRTDAHQRAGDLPLFSTLRSHHFPSRDHHH